MAPQVTSVHCSIHREALAAKKMQPDLMTVLDVAVKAVNLIKSHPLQMCMFAVSCKDEMEHLQQLLHTQVWWLSRRKVFSRFFELRDEMRVFLLDTKFEL